MTTLTSSTVQVGDIVRVADENRGHVTPDLRVDQEYRITDIQEDCNAGGGALVAIDGSPTKWGVSWFELVEAPARPTIDFSTPGREFARIYAGNALSPGLEGKHNEVLWKVNDGDSAVDAYALNAAVTAALSAAATRRLPDGVKRSDLTRQIRHLGHIVQAVLENHADNLPAYAEGERSRKVKDLERIVDSLDAELNEALDQNRSLREQIETERAAASDILADVQEALDQKSDVLDSVIEGASTVRTELEETTKALTQRTEERDVFAAGFVYALERATPAERDRLNGYIDGVADGVDSATE